MSAVIETVYRDKHVRAVIWRDGWNVYDEFNITTELVTRLYREAVADVVARDMEGGLKSTSTVCLSQDGKGMVWSVEKDHLVDFMYSLDHVPGPAVEWQNGVPIRLFGAEIEVIGERGNAFARPLMLVLGEK